MKKKRLLTLVGSVCLMLVLAALLLPACAKEEAPVVPAPVTPTPAPPVPPAPTPEKPKVVNWKMQSCFPPPEEVVPGIPSGYGEYCIIARNVKERTNGNFNIEIYIPGALFKGTECWSAVTKGSVDMVGCTGLYWSGEVAEGFFDTATPYGTRSYEEGFKLLSETDYQKAIRESYAKHNVYFVTMLDAATDTWISNFPIYSLADIQGKKIRATGIKAKMVALLGGIPVAVTGAEQYMALQRGTVDATIYPLYCGITYKFFEVTKYFVLPGIFVPAYINVLVNMDAWNRLPQEYKDIFLDEAHKMFVYGFTKRGPALDEAARKIAVEKYGLKEITLTEEQWTEFRAKVIPLWDELATKSPGCATCVRCLKEVAKIK